MTSINLYQIYYDEVSRGMLDPAFIPLDNTSNERPDWYEFWSIRRFLSNTQLNEDAWYGFFSPKFVPRMGLTGSAIQTVMRELDPYADVVLISPGWDQIAYFRNPFEQGEYWHPGLIEHAQEFVNHLGWDMDVANLVSDYQTTVFSNYVVAKPAYWRDWLALANQYFDYIEVEEKRRQQKTKYLGSQTGMAHMKTFVQERLSTLVLLRNTSLRKHFLDMTWRSMATSHLFYSDTYTKLSLISCEVMKRKFRQTGDVAYLNMYTAVRSEIQLVKGDAVLR